MLYRPALSWLHHHHFSEFARSAAPGLLELLRKHRISNGLVVDLGCGSGVWAHELTRAGFEVLGIDPSPAMLAVAATTAPGARFEAGALESRELPHCAAITAIGEIVNYSSWDGLRTFIARAAHALMPGGLLIFDAAESGSYPAYDESRLGGDDWSVIAIKESDGQLLRRRIWTFRNVEGEVRRDEETHELELYSRPALLSLLREHGFRVRVRRSYGTRRLPRGHAVYIAARIN